MILSVWKEAWANKIEVITASSGALNEIYSVHIRIPGSNYYFLHCRLCISFLSGRYSDDFIEGAKQGMKTVAEILPTLIGLMTAVGVLRLRIS